MKKNILVVVVAMLFSGLVQAQNLAEKEKSLTALAASIQLDSLEKGRVAAVVAFIPELVEALKVKDSYSYPFDSLRGYISILNAPDNSFRIFTWQLYRDNGSYRYYGAIQKNNLEKLELFPLFDFTDSLLAKENTKLTELKLNNNEWIGALYYNIVEKKVKKQTYYFLFGYDGNDLWSNKKLIEVLSFEKGKPVFGAPLLQVPNKDEYLHRFVMQYRKDAVVSLNYNEEEKMIIIDHLIAPEERLSDLQFTFLPDGSYSGYKWKKGKWQYVPKIKTTSLGDGNAPTPKPVNFKKEQQQPGKK
jgi:hypothetical protein